MKLLSPEALIILPIALLVDIGGILLTVFLADDYFITDVIGLIFIGGWSYFRSIMRGADPSQKLPSREDIKKARSAAKEAKTARKTTKAAKWAKRLKWIRPLSIIGEFLPWTFIGVLPLWTIWVVVELQTSEE